MKSSDPGQLLLIGVPGPELDAATARQFRDINPGGFILFGRNIQSPEQLRKLIDDLREVVQIEPIITIDQEGGRVSRLKLLGNEPPNAEQLRKKNDVSLIEQHGTITGRLLRAFGFNLDLCPVLDISFDDAADNSLRGRCYGSTAEEVIAKASCFNDALRRTGILSCGKHFPGYTSVTSDPHHELSVLNRSREALETHELKVFRHFTSRIDSMMIGHAVYQALDDSGLPASLSPTILKKLLREEMSFSGLIMTDDLDMGAIINHYGPEEMIRLALNAGNDLIMICHRVELAAQAKQVLERGDRAELDRALASVAQFKSKLAPDEPWDLAEFKKWDAAVWDLRVATLGAAQAAQRSAEDGKRSPVETY